MVNLCSTGKFFWVPLIILLLGTTTGFAQDSSVNIKANVIAAACSISADSQDQNVDLGKASTKAMTQPGDASAWKSFTINLESCPAGISTVVATLTGTPDPDAPDYYINSGSSTNVAIEVDDETQTEVLSNNKTMTGTIDINHKASLLLKSRMVAIKGAATSGNVTGVLQLSFDFR